MAGVVDGDGGGVFGAVAAEVGGEQETGGILWGLGGGEGGRKEQNEANAARAIGDRGNASGDWLTEPNAWSEMMTCRRTMPLPGPIAAARPYCRCRSVSGLGVRRLPRWLHGDEHYNVERHAHELNQSDDYRLVKLRLGDERDG